MRPSDSARLFLILALAGIPACAGDPATIVGQARAAGRRIAERRAAADPRREALDRVSAAAARGAVPVVVFDLDDTLFDRGPRVLQVLGEFAGREDVVRRYPQEASLLASAADHRLMRYSSRESAQALGVRTPEFLDELHAFSRARFRTSESVLLEQPIAGAPAYVSEVRRRGAVVVYLTARSPAMRDGTLESLRRHKFPEPDGRFVLLLMNERSEEAAVHKGRAFPSIAQRGTVVAGFENEPENAVLFARTYPAALSVFLDTRRTGGDPPPGMPAIRDYLLAD